MPLPTPLNGFLLPEMPWPPRLYKRPGDPPSRRIHRLHKRRPFLACAVPDDQVDDDRRSCLGLPLSLPYEVESLADMDARLEAILCRLTECVQAEEWFTGFNTWNSALNMWVLV